MEGISVFMTSTNPVHLLNKPLRKDFRIIQLQSVFFAPNPVR